MLLKDMLYYYERECMCATSRSSKFLRRKKCINEGYPPHQCNAMDIFSKVWYAMTAKEVHKCWTKKMLLTKDTLK